MTPPWIETDGAWTVRGDPTEGALVVLGQKAGLDPEALRKEFPRVAEIPFSSDVKRMSTFHQGPDGVLMYVKGAPESLLPRAPMMLTAHGEQDMSAEDREAVQEQAAAMAREALRVLGLAYRRLPAVPDLESDAADPELVWVGLVGMIDPARPEARQAVNQCHRAGIRVIMVTGDHPVTASAVAREVGLIPPGTKSHAVITGPELNQMSDPELKEALRTARVFARVAPEHKLRLVDILKEQGEVVAMTGDGVNDAPALKRADIGVAMGITGTEVTKETAAMILADDNFATLVAAVEEGRAIFDNIKKYMIFLLSCNLAEIFVLTGALFIGMPLPLLALQILWVNLDSDGLPAFALGVDPKAPDTMARPPRPPGEGIFSRSVNVPAGGDLHLSHRNLDSVVCLLLLLEPLGHSRPGSGPDPGSDHGLRHPDHGGTGERLQLPFGLPFPVHGGILCQPSSGRQRDSFHQHDAGGHLLAPPVGRCSTPRRSGGRTGCWRPVSASP